MNNGSITKNVVFERMDYDMLVEFARQQGFGRRGYSAALRRVMREWRTMKGFNLNGQDNPPPVTVEIPIVGKILEDGTVVMKDDQLYIKVDETGRVVVTPSRPLNPPPTPP